MGYYQIPADRIAKEVIEHRKARREWQEKVDAWSKSHGGIGNVSRGYGGIHNYEVSGLISSEAPDPKAWKPSKEEDGWYYPRRNTKLGKAIIQELNELNKEKPSIYPVFHIANLRVQGFWTNYKIYSPGYFFALDDSFVFEIDDAAGYEPPEYAVELKASQFHKILEDTQEAGK